jgi:CubicO group peptidase (beta-lactamase class C family)
MKFRLPIPVVLPFLVTLILSSCGSEKKIDSHAAEDLHDYFTQVLPPNEPGGAVLIMKNSVVVFSKGYGIEDISNKKPITSQTLFNLGSISKTFVANGILMLQEKGMLSVEDSIGKYFPDFKNKTIAGQVKIKHLLTHTSGLPDTRRVSRDSVFYLTAKDAENWYPVTQADSLQFDPGERFEYSNPAFNALALIIEQVSGMKWQRFIEQNILVPSHMRSSTITDGPHPQSGVAHAYQKNKNEWIEDDYGEEPTFAAAGNGGVWSSVEELALYERALQQGIFLKPENMTDSRTVKNFDNWADSTEMPSIGWSWFIGQTSDGLQTIGHTGDQGGFLCNYVTLPEKKILVVILCNTRRDVGSLTHRTMQWLKGKNYLD